MSARIALTAALAVVSIGAVVPSAGAAARAHPGEVWDHGPGGVRYVAMGDSAASGPDIPDQRHDPTSCDRSDHNFPSIAAARLAVRAFSDVTCGGATIADLYVSQTPGEPPQLDALSRSTTLVTLGPIGANDVGLTTVVVSCLVAAVEPTCQSAYTGKGRVAVREEIEALLPQEIRALRNVHQRAPHAQVFVVGYGRYLPPGGCYPTQPFLPRAANEIQGDFDALDRVLAQAAAATGSGYVTLQSGDAIHHTSCAPVGQRWLEGLVPDSSAEPFHPSALGMAAFGRMVARRCGDGTGGAARRALR